MLDDKLLHVESDTQFRSHGATIKSLVAVAAIGVRVKNREPTMSNAFLVLLAHYSSNSGPLSNANLLFRQKGPNCTNGGHSRTSYNQNPVQSSFLGTDLVPEYLQVK